MSVSPARYAQRIARGDCGKCGRPAYAGASLCPTHQRKAREAQRRREMRTQEATAAHQIGCCGQMHAIPCLPCRLACCGRVIALPDTP